jgi:MscS family membrane protein
MWFIAYPRPQIAASESRLGDPLLPVLSGALKAFILVIVAVLILQHSGYNISGLLAGLGLGGLAVALVRQSTLVGVSGSIEGFRRIVT